MNIRWFLSIVFAAFATAQAGELPQFETAVVKTTAPGSYGKPYGIMIGSQFTARGATARALIAQAWDLQSDTVLGGPKWLDTERYDITARPDLSRGVPGKEQLHPMLRSLLIERFHVAAHEDTRELPGWSLIPGRNGPRLRVADAAPGTQRKQVAHGHIGGSGMPILYLTDTLSQVLGRPVADETGLKGTYDFQLDWSPDEMERAVGAPGASRTEPGPSLFQAIQEQLGLRLQSTKKSVRVLIVDKVEKPEGN